ncbi:hypothetical protein LTR12_012477 [Friedmanniomyces endolithicus]|nr:hypothetical protein LTR74_003292 [Friedmanniomyces endolithicus]KAK1813153.1 hypothetical protein LTR12_012477 [Friedmanniomyces endolithicus]
MEYDMAAGTGPPESKAYPHESVSSEGNDGKMRIKAPKVDVSALAESITLPFSGRTARNRFLKAPMTERLCHWNQEGEDINARGYPSEEYTRLYERWGEGEIGIIVAGNLMLRYDAVEAFGNPILQDDHDNRTQAFRKVSEVAKKHGSLFIAQLSHPGRQGGAALNPNPVSASDVQLKIEWAGNKFNKPRGLSIPEIKDMRTDEYGGANLTNRSRIIFEIIDEIKQRVNDPTFIICVKINSVEFQPGGQTPDDCKNLCLKLEEAGVDLIDLSGGTFEGRAFEHKKASTRARESYFIEFAEMIRPLLKQTKVYVTGGFRTAAGMSAAISSGACDGVGLGRPLGAEPYLCKEILEGRVTGAIENFVPLPLNTQATGTQLQQVGMGDRLVSDWSDEGEVQRWVEANEKETARKIALLPKVDSSGFPPLKAEVGFEYLR